MELSRPEITVHKNLLHLHKKIKVQNSPNNKAEQYTITMHNIPLFCKLKMF